MVLKLERYAVHFIVILQYFYFDIFYHKIKVLCYSENKLF